MAFNPASCATEEYTGLPVCPIAPSDLEMLHANIAQVVEYMATHHIPRDQWDAPYVYRDYLSDAVSGNDVAALSRVMAAAVARNIDLPPLLAPLYAGQDVQVVDSDVHYVAENARVIAELLGPMLSAMRAADEDRAFPWGWVAVIAVSAGLLGAVLTAPSRKRDKREAK